MADAAPWHRALLRWGKNSEKTYMYQQSMFVN